MKVLVFTLVFWALSNEHSVSLHHARVVFEQAVTNESLAAEFLVNTSNTKNNTLIGYKGAITMIMANHTFNPIKKFDCFNQGKTLLEYAIKKEPHNIELRYVRFSVQCNAPSFLGYHSEKKVDKGVLLQGIGGVNDFELKNKITQFLLQSSELTAQEKLALR